MRPLINICAGGVYCRDWRSREVEPEVWPKFVGLWKALVLRTISPKSWEWAAHEEEHKWLMSWLRLVEERSKASRGPVGWQKAEGNGKCLSPCRPQKVQREKGQKAGRTGGYGCAVRIWVAGGCSGDSHKRYSCVGLLETSSKAPEYIFIPSFLHLSFSLFFSFCFFLVLFLCLKTLSLWNKTKHSKHKCMTQWIISKEKPM